MIYLCGNKIRNDMKKAIYNNKATKETYTLANVTGIEQAWNMWQFVCGRNNWNPATFTNDVTVKIIEA